MTTSSPLVLAAVLLLCGLFAVPAHGVYNDFRIGRGIFDITGTVTQVGFMGYAMLQQTGKGLHFRQFARAFVIEDVQTGRRTVYVSADLGMIFQSVHDEVIRLLSKQLPGGLYNESNVLLSGTHTHSGPGGHSQHPLYDITTLGFHRQNWVVITEGITQAIVNAHNSLSRGGRILINQGELLGANTNRGTFAYQANPPEERAKYAHDVDKTMVVLRMQDENGADLGAIALFAAHGTSMFNNNRLVSGDNKGYASYVFERAVNGWSVGAGRGPFVAAFGQSNEGDVSPNIKGAFCLFPKSVEGQPCDVEHSTCAGRVEGCQGQGPHGLDMFANTAAIGARQASFAQALWANATTPLVGGTMLFTKIYVDMSNVTVLPPFAPAPVTTCPGSLGDGFAGGTTDGPGAFNFIEGVNATSNNTNTYWNWISAHILADPPAWVKACQYPKPILLYTQGITFPAQWTSNILPLQIFQWGQFVLIGVPGEFTTMSGRRLRDTVRQAYQDAGKLMNGMVFSIAGLSNSYSHYITTHEEYSVQRYAGASTLFGPNTLRAYQQEYYNLASKLVRGQPIASGPSPPNLANNTFNFLPPVIEDTAPGGKFGAVYKEIVASSFALGDVVNVTFWGSDLRTNLLTNSSYLTVDRMVNGSWTTVLDDADFDTRLYWERAGLAGSHITCSWHVAAEEGGVVARGATYRITLRAYHKPLIGTPKPYFGASKSFTLK